MLHSWIALQADTNVSPRSMVPSVKNLALKVNLGVLEEVQILASFLRQCFPNIETLDLEVTICALIPSSGQFFHHFSLIELYTDIVAYGCSWTYWKRLCRVLYEAQSLNV
jgi:hypothetical protein